MTDWKKVDLTQYPFHFTEEHPEIDVYNKAVQKELGGKDLEYYWAEEGGDEPEHLENFDFNSWEQVFACDGYGDEFTGDCQEFGLVSMIKGLPLKGPSLKGVEWAIDFEMNCSIWIRSASN